MRNMFKLHLQSLIVFFFITSTIFSQTIVLPDNWIFKIGDDPSFSAENIDESGWVKTKVPGNWEDQGFPNYDGYAWYRLHFRFDDSQFQNEELYLFLGRIDDVDETFLNGVKIGSSGTFPPNPLTAWNDQRGYKIPKEILKNENVIAIRVYDIFGGGGIHSGLVGILNQQEYEYEMNPPKGAKKSFYQLTTSNGLIAGVYNERKRQVEKILPHIFKAYDENKFVQPFITNLKLETNEKPVSTNYYQNTHIVNVDYKNINVKYFASFTQDNKIFYAVISGSKEIVSPLKFSFNKSDAEVLTDEVTIAKDENQVEKYFLFSFNDSLHNNGDVLSSSVKKLKENKSNLVEDELNFMKAVFARANFPDKISSEQRNVYEQSITVLKMAQVSQSEVFPNGRGQILASLPPGVWNICWLRDGMYALLGLNSAGLFDEAKKLLTFYLNADAGYYKNFVWGDGKDYGVGVDYQISVTRYFGIGKEESDFNAQGPNIELDGFGFFLYTFSDYINRSGDKKFFKENYKLVSEKVADALIHCIDKNDLIRIDSGPWERHLPGKQYAYTSITAAAGLKDYAELLKKMGLKSEKYYEASKRITKGIKNNLMVEGKFLKGNAEGIDNSEYEFYDTGIIEAFSLGVLRDKKFFNSNMKEYDKAIRIASDRGFSRVNGVDSYDVNEWIMIDLRTASSYLKFGEKEKAKSLIDWITAQANYNFNLLPELYDLNKATYEGAVPMVGFGAGAYLKAINDFYK